MSQVNAPFTGLIFFLIDFTIALSFFVIEKWINNPQHKVLMQAAADVVFFHPAALIVFIFLSISIYLLSLVFGGQGSFGRSLSAMGLSSFPLIFLFVPLLLPFGIAWWGYLLVLSFQKIHKYKYRYAVLSVTFPLLTLLILMFTIGFLNLSIWMQLGARLITVKII